MSVLEVILTPLGKMLRNKRPDMAYSVRNAKQLAAPRTITLTSPAFEDGGEIPSRHASMDMGPNISPELRWSGVPAGTAQLLLVMEDIDLPLGSKPGLHMAALLAPDTTGLAEGEATTGNPAIRWVPASRGRKGYVGPRPLPGHGVHRYGFHLYALDRAIPAGQPLDSFDAVLAAVDGHVTADGFLEGIKKG